MDAKSNNLNWFEVPAPDINRAKTFYETIFNIEMPTMEMMGMEMAFFPGEQDSGKAMGGLAKSDMHKPSTDGPIIYLNANPALEEALDKVEAAGGKIIMPKSKISDEIGFMAIFIDSEGNRMAMHSQG